MTPSTPSRPSGPAAGVARPSSDDPVLATALGVWRRDVASVAPSPALVGDVLRAAAGLAHGAAFAREDELDRVRRVARIYASAAAVLLAVGVGGALLVRHGGAGRAATSPSALADLELHRMSLVGLDSVADLPLGGR